MQCVCVPAHGQDVSTKNSAVTLKSAVDEPLSPVLEQLAKIIGALDLMHQVRALQSELSNTELANSAPFEYLSKRQKLIYIRQKLNLSLETSNLEVNATRGQVESLMAQVQNQQAKMVEKRARALRRNTIINFVSGGITKMVGYSIALGGVDTPSNILEIMDGAIQCGLSGTVMKDLHSEGHILKEMPSELTVLSQPTDPQGIYAKQVWGYLNETTDGRSGESRRIELKKAWQARGFFDRHSKASVLRESGTLPNHISLARITPQLLDDRLAMLSETRSVVSEMHKSLMELSQTIKKSYDDDPSFDWPVASKVQPTL